MKKIFLLLLVPLIAIAFISCELDTISNFMGAVGSNVLIDQGLIQVDDSSAVNAANTLNDIMDDLENIDSNQVASIKENIADAVQSPQKKAKLKEEMSKPAEGVGKTDLIPEDFDDDLKVFLEDILPDELTQGDVLAAVMVRDLAGKMNSLPDDPTEDEVMEFVSEALQTIDIIKTVSSIDEVTIDALVKDLMGMLTGSDSSDGSHGMRAVISRDGGDGDDGVEEYIAMIAPLAQTFINAAGKKQDGSIDPDGLNRLVASYRLMRTSYEKMAASIDKQKGVGVALELDDLFNYLVSVVLTEGHNFLKLDDKTDEYGGKVSLAMVLQQLADLDSHATEPPAFFKAKDEDEWEAMLEAYAGPEGETIKPVLTTFGNTMRALATKVEKGAINDLIDDLIDGIEDSLFGDNN